MSVGVARTGSAKDSQREAESLNEADALWQREVYEAQKVATTFWFGTETEPEVEELLSHHRGVTVALG